MTIFKWIGEVKRRNALLANVGLGHFVLLLAMLVLFFIDSRTVLGINVWIKPIKFAVSIGIFCWTMAWFMYDLQGFSKTIKVLSWVFAIAMMTEMAIIFVQAARGQMSHFNISSPLNATLFSIMGAMIGISSLGVLVVLILYLLRKPDLPAAYLLGVRLGLLSLLLASYEGTLIIQNLGHTIGAPDGGRGLPLLNWSVSHGDLRVAHFLGLHGMQFIPLVAWLIHKYELKDNIGKQLFLTWLFAIIYLFFIWYLYHLAMLGKPLLHVGG